MIQQCVHVCIYVCVCVPASAETLTLQQDHGEEKMSKIKQLLVKTKKDLADAKKQVCGCLFHRISIDYVA